MKKNKLGKCSRCKKAKAIVEYGQDKVPLCEECLGKSLEKTKRLRETMMKVLRSSGCL